MHHRWVVLFSAQIADLRDCAAEPLIITPSLASGNSCCGETIVTGIFKSKGKAITSSSAGGDFAAQIDVAGYFQGFDFVVVSLVGLGHCRLRVPSEPIVVKLAV